MAEALPNKLGANDPRHYDWQQEFSWLDPADGVTLYDTAKVYGLAMHARDLEVKVRELESRLISDSKTGDNVFFSFLGKLTRWTRPV